MSKRVVLVDGNAMAHAAWHGYPERIGSDGLSYRAVHGFLSKLHRMDRDYQWDEICVIFDPIEGSLYRKSLFPAYKAHRPEQDPDLVRQLLLIEEALADFGIPTLKVAGVESDDVIGTLAKKHARAGCIVMVVTPDKDMAQLVEPNIGILRPLRGAAAIETPFDYVGVEGVIEKYGVTPSQIADWLALIGDVSDNIPGVNGVGPKKATQLINQYGDVRTIMTNVEGIKGKLGESLLASRLTIDTTVKLTTIQTELDCDAWHVPDLSPCLELMEAWTQRASMPHWMGRFNFHAGPEAGASALPPEGSSTWMEASLEDPTPFD